MFVLFFWKHVCNIHGISAAGVHSPARCGEQTGKRTLWQCLNPTLEHVQIQNSLLEVPTDAGLIVSDPASVVPVNVGAVQSSQPQICYLYFVILYEAPFMSGGGGRGAGLTSFCLTFPAMF